MKFSISRNALSDLLGVVISAVPAKSTLPILSNVLIKADKEGLTLVATDLDISIRTKGEASVSEEGSITVPAKRIGEIVRELPDADVKVKTVKLTPEQSAQEVLLYLEREGYIGMNGDF